MNKVHSNTLDEMCELIVDCPHSTPKWTNTGHLVIRNQNIRNGRLDLSDKSYTNHEDYLVRVRRAVPQGGDLIFTREAPMGEICQVPEGLECCVGQRQVLLRPAKGVSSDYLLYAMQSPFVRHQIFWNEGTGSTVSNVRIPVLKKLEIPRQGQLESGIARLLKSFDDKIELNRRMNETLEEMARALFRDWFVDFGPTRRQMAGATDPAAIMGHAFPTGDMPADVGSGAKPITATTLAPLFPAKLGEDGLPEGWKLGVIGDLCARIFSGGTPKTTVPNYWGGDLPWLSSGETRESFLLTTEKTITQEGVDNSSTREANAGSTVIASAGQGKTRGQTSYLAFDTYINQSVVALEANPDLLPGSVLYLDLERRYEEFRSISDAHSSRGSLTTKLLAGLQTVLAPREAFLALGSIVAPLFEKIVANKQENQTLAEMRDLLLPKLMSGEIRLKDVEDVL